MRSLARRAAAPRTFAVNRFVAFSFSTDLTLTAAQGVEYYAARFAIELAFRDLKNHFGLGHYQAGRVEAAERHGAQCLGAYTGSPLLLLAGGALAQGTPWRKAPPVGTTGQSLSELRWERQAEIMLAICERHGISADKRDLIYADLLQVA